MADSRHIAGLAGPTLMAITSSEALNLDIWTRVSTTLVYLNGVLLFVAGLAIVRTHNVWIRRWPVLVTLLGWVALGGGPWLFERVFGPPWREAGELARALAPYIAAHFVAAPLAVVTMAWRAQGWAFRLALLGQVAFVAALAAGLHRGGLLGGAWAVSAVMVPYFGWYFWRLARWPCIPEPLAPPGKEAP